VQTRKLARALNVIGLMNVQFAIQNGHRLRARGQSARLAHGPVRVQRPPVCRLPRSPHGHDRPQAARSGVLSERVPKYYSVKEAVFPFTKFPEADPILGPEMKSTGEVMGTGRTFGEAYAEVAERLRRDIAAARVLPDQRARARQKRCRASGAASDCARLHDRRHPR